MKSKNNVGEARERRVVYLASRDCSLVATHSIMVQNNPVKRLGRDLQYKLIVNYPNEDVLVVLYSLVVCLILFLKLDCASGQVCREYFPNNFP